MMVPTDSKFFFANDVFRGLGAQPAAMQQVINQEAKPQDPPEDDDSGN